MQKQHRVLTCFMPLLACVLGFAMVYVCGLISGNEFVLGRFLLSLLVQSALVALTVWFIRRPLTRLFPQLKDYRIGLPPWYVLVMLVLVTPLWCILKGRLLYMLFPGAELQPMAYSAGELQTDLILSLSAIFVAPAYEELFFRYLPLAVYRKKATQIIVGVLVAMFFGLLHTKNLLGAFVDAMIFTLAFICTRRIGISMALHGCINFWPMAFCVLVHLGLLDIQNSSVPVIWLIGNGATLIVAAVMAVVGVAVWLFCRRKRICE